MYKEYSFSLFVFYEKRLRRLIPALFTMLLISYGIYLLISTQGEYRSFYQAKPWLPFLQVSNFGFAFNKFDYWSPKLESIFYLHTWSLAVEEQFYLIFPLIVMVFIHFKHLGKYFISIISIIALISFILSYVVTDQIAFICLILEDMSFYLVVFLL